MPNFFLLSPSLYLFLFFFFFFFIPVLPALSVFMVRLHVANALPENTETLKQPKHYLQTLNAKTAVQACTLLKLVRFTSMSVSDVHKVATLQL